ncbi:MAG: hypothetical protein ABIA04_14340 [Pseudomonadota bacterium]
MQKFYPILIILLIPVFFLFLSCADDYDTSGSTANPSTVDGTCDSDNCSLDNDYFCCTSYEYPSGREHTLAPNYNNDYCFKAATDEVTFLTCSLIALRTVEVDNDYYSGRETIGQITGCNQENYTDAGLYDLTYTKFKNEADFFDELHTKSFDYRYVLMGDGSRDFLKTYLENQLEEFCSYNQGDGPTTYSDLCRYYSLIPNYDNDDCFKDLTNELEFAACSVLSCGTFYNNGDYLSGRELLADLLHINTTGLSDHGLYDQVLQDYESTDDFLADVNDYDIVIYDGSKYTSYEFFEAQVLEFNDYLDNE